MRVESPFLRASAITTGVSQGTRATTPAGSHEMNGALITAKVKHAHGSVLLLQVSWKRNGAPIRDAALFVRLRIGAPLYSIQAFVPRDRENTCGDRFTVFSGHGDLMNAEELMLLGIEVPRSWRGKFTDIQEVEECFVISELMPEVKARPQLEAISTPTGVQMREVPATPQRQFRLRRT